MSGPDADQYGTLERAGDVSILRYERRLAHPRERVWRGPSAATYTTQGAATFTVNVATGNSEELPRFRERRRRPERP